VNSSDEPGNVTLKGMCNGARCSDSTKLLLTFENESTNSSGVMDYSTNGVHGTCYGMGGVCNVTTGRAGQGILFDGVDDYILVTTND